MEATVLAKADEARVRTMVASPNGYEQPRGNLSMKKLWILLVVLILGVAMYGQFSSRPSYQQLKQENEELHSQLAEVHSDAEDAQSELETLKSDVDDVQTKARECDDCDDVQSAASDLDGPMQNLESSLESIEAKSQE